MEDGLCGLKVMDCFCSALYQLIGEKSFSRRTRQEKYVVLISSLDDLNPYCKSGFRGF